MVSPALIPKLQAQFHKQEWGLNHPTIPHRIHEAQVPSCLWRGRGMTKAGEEGRPVRNAILVTVRIRHVWTRVCGGVAVGYYGGGGVCAQRTWIMYTYTYIHTFIHTYIHTSMHACIHAYMHVYIHTYVRTYAPTYIHTYGGLRPSI